MRTLVVIVLTFITYSLLFLTSSQKKFSATEYHTKNFKVRTITGAKIDKDNYIKIYKMDDLQQSLTHTYRQIYFIFLEQFKSYKKIFLISSLSLGILSIISLVFIKGNFSVITLLINKFIFLLGDTLLAVFSFLSIGSWFFFKHNFWQDLGTLMFFIPFGFVIISTFAFKLYDFNYPIWSSLFKSFIIPILSGVLINLRI